MNPKFSKKTSTAIRHISKTEISDLIFSFFATSFESLSRSSDTPSASTIAKRLPFPGA